MHHNTSAPDAPSPRRVILATLVVAAICAAFWLLWRWHAVVFILFVAIVISAAIKPLVDWMYRRGLPRPAGIVLVYLLLLLILAGLVLGGAPLVGEQAVRLVEALPGAYRSLRDSMLRMPNLLLWRLALALPEQLPLVASPDATGEETMLAVGQVAAVAGAAARGALAIVLTFILAFYWTVEGSRVKQAALLLIPLEKREESRDLINTIDDRLGKYIVGQGLLMLIMGLLSLSVYVLLGLPYALVLALVAGLMEAVPLVGPGLGAIPAAIVAYSVDPGKALVVILATLVLQQLENAFLVPRIMRNAVGVHPLLTLFALIALGSLFGVPGALVAVPFAAIVQLVLERYMLHPDAMVAQDPAGRDARSVLHYEIQEFIRDVKRQARSRNTDPEGDGESPVDDLEAIAVELSTLLANNGEASEEKQ